MDAPTLRVRLLGGLDLRVGEDQVPPLDSGRAESLLAYLLLHREAAQPRQRLAFLLWPDSSEPQARTNLRHVLHNLRRAVPDADRLIDAGPRTLQWRADAPLWLDVAVFEQALAKGRLEDAVEAYAGDLLEGSYDDWLLEERERLRDLHLDALERLAHEAEARGDWAASIRSAERLVRHDPLREETYQLLMRAHDARGDRARALRAYHVCAATLQRELGIEPSAATREAYEALLPGAPGAASPAGPPFIGRAPERARLSELWRESQRGRVQLGTGEPGIGKSRLVEELRSSSAHGGALTAEARSYSAEGAVAFGPVVAWLRSEAIAAQLRRLDRAHLTELARLLPELAIDAAAAAGVQRIVKLSAHGAEAGSPLAFWDWQGRIEQHLARSGVPAVVLRPAAYMTNLLGSAEAIAHTAMLFAPAGPRVRACARPACWGSSSTSSSRRRRAARRRPRGPDRRGPRRHRQRAAGRRGVRARPRSRLRRGDGGGMT